MEALGGSRFWGKESSSTDPKSGEQWTPFGKVNLLLGGKKIQGAQKPSSCVVGRCLFVRVFVYAPPCLCVYAGIVSGLVLFWCIVLFSLF